MSRPPFLILLALMLLNTKDASCCYYRYQETYPYTGGLPAQRLYRFLLSGCVSSRVSHQSEINFVYQKLEISYNKKRKTLRFFYSASNVKVLQLIYIEFQGVTSTDLKRISQISSRSFGNSPPKDYYIFELARFGRRAINLRNCDTIDFISLSKMRSD